MMRRNALVMPIFSLVLGTLGYYLRRLELIFVFDSVTGLPERGSGITYALIWSTLAFLLVSALFAFRVKIGYTCFPDFDTAFGTEPLAYPMSFLFIGLLWLVATVRYYYSMKSLGGMTPQLTVFVLLSALSAVSVVLFAIEVYQDPQRKTKQPLSIVPVIFLCYWLIFLYRQNASNPILLSYCYQCLAIIASTLGFYFVSGFVFGRSAPSKALLAFFTAIYFSFVALADNLAGSIKLIFVLIIVINAIYSSMLIRNLQKKTG